MFLVVIGEVDNKELGIYLGAIKIRKFTDKFTTDKRKLLLKQLDTDVDDLFPDSLDDVRAMSLTNQVKNVI